MNKIRYKSAMDLPIRLAALSSLLLFPAIACSTGAAPPEGGPPPGTPPAAQSTPPVTGKWTSATCGARTYERRLALEADGSFTAEDRVSPCPPGTACIWSGIVLRRGKYTVDASGIHLAVDGPSAGAGQPLPATMAIEPAGAPAEVLPDGARCAYTRAP